jgi:hypothetical protein
MEFNNRFRPALSKGWLHLLSGLMWSGVGIMLCSLAYGWLAPLRLVNALLLAVFGILLAVLINSFGFGPLAGRNITRIDDYKSEKVCLFAFQQWTSYPLVLVMVSLGVVLRHYSPIPKHFLAIVYIGIGGGLFLASLRYYLRLVSGEYG